MFVPNFNNIHQTNNNLLQNNINFNIMMRPNKSNIKNLNYNNEEFPIQIRTKRHNFFNIIAFSSENNYFYIYFRNDNCH